MCLGGEGGGGGVDSKLRVHEFVIYIVHITILKRSKAASLLN